MLLEILAVSAAILFLFLSGILLARKTLSLRRTVNRFQGKVDPKSAMIMDQSDAAQRRVFSIVERREILFHNLWSLQASMRKMSVIVSAAQAAWRPVARVLAYVGL